MWVLERFRFLLIVTNNTALMLVIVPCPPVPLSYNLQTLAKREKKERMLLCGIIRCNWSTLGLILLVKKSVLLQL